MDSKNLEVLYFTLHVTGNYLLEFENSFTTHLQNGH